MEVAKNTSEPTIYFAETYAAISMVKIHRILSLAAKEPKLSNYNKEPPLFAIYHNTVAYFKFLYSSPVYLGPLETDFQHSGG